jgi:hypothetical protein
MNEKELQLGNAVAGRGIQLEASRSLHINQWAGFIDLSVSLTFITLGFGPQAVSSVVRAKLRTFNHAFNFKNTTGNRSVLPVMERGP